MTLACKDCVHWLSPDAKKKCFYDERRGLYFFSTFFLSRLSNPVLIFTSYYKHTVVAVGLTTIWFETASVIKKKTYRVSSYFHRKMTLPFTDYYLSAVVQGWFLLIIFLTEGAARYNNIQTRTRIKGWVYYYYILYLVFFFLKSGSRVHRLYYMCLECGVGFKVDYKPFGPIGTYIHRR